MDVAVYVDAARAAAGPFGYQADLTTHLMTTLGPVLVHFRREPDRPGKQGFGGASCYTFVSRSDQSRRCRYSAARLSSSAPMALANLTRHSSSSSANVLWTSSPIVIQ